MTNLDPHSGQPLLRKGLDPASARITVILVHGRGGRPADILNLADEIRADDIAYLAPQAAGATWYPFSFLAPMDQNEPGLSSSLKVLDDLVIELGRHGVPAERIALLGFSQGACLALEFAARHPRSYRAIVGLSGGLIGPPGTSRTYTGRFVGTKVFLACSDVDAHIPLERVHETAAVFRNMGAGVDERIYPGMGHTITPAELDVIRSLFFNRSVNGSKSGQGRSLL
jgi:predicted esterase